MDVRESHERWLLPDGLDEILPPHGEQYERLRRQLLDLFSSWGYDLVVPPLIEYIESLLTGLGRDLDLQTFKLTDLESGRMLGVRADMTPQVARIDAHQLRSLGPTRLCYVGTVLRTRRDGPDSTRSPVQVGAELYGHSGLESDAEVIRLMLAMLQTAGIENAHLDIGNAAIFLALSDAAALSTDTREAVFNALQRKAGADVRGLVADSGAVSSRLVDAFEALTVLNGPVETLDSARDALNGVSSEVVQAVEKLARLADILMAQDVEVHVDLAELRGYRYHPGVVFAAFVPGEGQEVARGGRYDNIGEAFGRARPATGFSSDMRTLLRVANRAPQPSDKVFVPWFASDRRAALIDQLRSEGRRVVAALSESDDDPTLHDCSHTVDWSDTDPRVVAVSASTEHGV